MFCVRSLFCYALLCVLSSFAKRGLVALLLWYSECHVYVVVLCHLFMVTLVGLFCLFDLILYIPVNNFSVMSGWVFLD